MASIVLFDGPAALDLQPLTFTRPVCHLRIGIYTIAEKWSNHVSGEVFIHTRPHLKEKFQSDLPTDTGLFVDGSVLPTATFIQLCYELGAGEAITSAGQFVAFKGTVAQLEDGSYKNFVTSEIDAGLIVEINTPADIFSLNGFALEQDLEHLMHLPAELDDSNIIFGSNLYVDEGARIMASTINTETGPVYIGKNAIVEEGCTIRGPFALCEGATLKMGAKIYGPTTIGPFSKVSGEVSNSVIQGYSNKGHDGFLGNSVLGEWCNLGADSNTSNLKNNYGEVKVWSYRAKELIKSGKIFHGLVMGDHSKCSINTMFNTGTVVGVNANIFGADFPPKFVPSFSWGGATKMTTYDLDKSFEVAKAVTTRRDVDFGKQDQDIMQSIFDMTKEFRT
jgi:UDP-N-acetylglucosamine diphosphorylase/glucosamine-1-phosphate N-acetyltransferase